MCPVAHAASVARTCNAARSRRSASRYAARLLAAALLRSFGVRARIVDFMGGRNGSGSRHPSATQQGAPRSRVLGLNKGLGIELCAFASWLSWGGRNGSGAATRRSYFLVCLLN